MAKIKFETGQVVNFNGNPTQQDIDEVASKLGINKQTITQQPEPKPQGVLSKIGNALTQSEQNLGKDIGRGLLGGDKYFKQITDQYTKNVDTLTKLAEKQTNPTLKQKYLNMAKSSFEEGQKVGVDFKGRSWEQIAGDVLGTALDVGTTVSGLGAIKAVGKTASLGSKVTKGALEGAKYGAAYGITGGLQEDKSALGVAGQGITGGLLGGATGGAISGVTGLAQKGIQKLAPKTGEAENVVGRILQGKIKDKKPAMKVLSNIGIDEIKSGGDLENILNKKIETLSNAQNEVLAKKANPLSNKELKLNIKVGEQNKTYGYVKDALNELKKFYTSTNDKINIEKISQIEKKLNTQGLTLTEVNNIAKLHGKDLNAFNISGELASGLSKQAAENTRKGLKSIIRQKLEGEGKASELIDKELARTIKTRDLIIKRNEKVNSLQQKIKNRNILQKLTYAGVKAFNTITGGAPKAAFEALGVSNIGNKVDNFVDLERTLSKDLNLLQKLSSMSDEEIAKKINNIKNIGNVVGGIGKIGNLATQKLINIPNQ